MSNGNVLKGLLCLVTFSLILTVYYVNLSELRFDVNLSFFHPRRTGRLFDQQEIEYKLKMSNRMFNLLRHDTKKNISFQDNR